MAWQCVEICSHLYNQQTIWTAVLCIHGSICASEITCMHVCHYKGKQTGLSFDENKVTFE